MTLQENQAIVLLTKMIEQHIEVNGKQHDTIQLLLTELEKRISKQLEQGTARMDAFEQHCEEESEKVDAALAPSPYGIVGRGVVALVLKSAALVAAVTVITVFFDQLIRH